MQIFVYFFSAFFVLCFFVPVRAATYTVTNTNNDGAGSLRSAINGASSTPADDTINFNIPGCETGGCAINGAVFSIGAAGKLTIANNPNASNIALNANNQGRVFVVGGGANLTLSGITLTGGNSNNTVEEPFFGGGGIYNRGGGTVTLIKSAVAGNTGSSSEFGGGVANRGNLTLINSSIEGNSGYSGGIYNVGTVVLTNSSVSGNSGKGIFCDDGSVTANGSSINGNGSAIFNNLCTMEITNSTINGNTTVDSPNITNYKSITLTSTTIKNNAHGITVESDGINLSQLKVIDSIIEHNGNSKYTFGGAISCIGEYRDVIVINSTISNNTGIFAGGIVAASGSTLTLINSTIVKNFGSGQVVGGIYNSGSGSLRNTIVADNTIPGSPSDVFNAGPLISQGNNLIGYSTESGVSWQSSDILDQSPRLAPLGNYGGATQTFALTNNSPAVNAGNNCVTTLNGCGNNNPAIPTDQRGAARVGNVDIGAFEINNTSNGGTFRAVTRDGRATLPFNFQLTPDSGNFTYSVTPGTLPPGLVLSNSLAVNAASARLSAKNSLAPQAGPYSITGTPTMGGTFNYTVTASDGTNAVSTDYTTTIAAPPTAAAVEIGGRVLNGENRGIANAVVTLTDQNGQTRAARTNAFGYFRFEDVPAGATCIISVAAKRYQFAPRVIFVTENVTDLTFSPE